MRISEFEERYYELGLHRLGKISLGTQYAKGTDAKPTPIRVCAAIRRWMSFDPGAMADPTKEITHDPTSKILRAWKVSDADEITGPSTACTRDRAFGTHVCASTPSRSRPI